MLSTQEDAEAIYFDRRHGFDDQSAPEEKPVTLAQAQPDAMGGTCTRHQDCSKEVLPSLSQMNWF